MKLSTRLIIPFGVCAALALGGCGASDSATSGEQSGEATTQEASDGSGGLCDVTVLEGAQSLDIGNGDVAGSEAALKGVVLSEDPAAAPTLSYESPLAVKAEAVLVTDEGDGEPVSEGQVITFNYMVCDVVTGEKMVSTWGKTADADQPATLALSAGNFGETFVKSLNGVPVGSRVLWGQPGYSAEESGTGVASNGYVYAISITDARTLPDSASGTEVTPSDDTLPTITFEGSAPDVKIPSTFTEPTALVDETLIEGDGAVVEAGQTIAVKYTGWLTDGTKFDSTWTEDGSSAPVMFQIGTNQVIQGWDQGLVGKKVGSRVLLVIPSDLGYGEKEAGSIPAGSTLIFVVDILDAF